jgi:3-dehydrosphinganine reductase
MKEFNGKTALITGGSSGIGLAVSRALATRGAHVWLLARDEDKLDRALEDVNSARSSTNQHCGKISADVADPEQVQEALSRIIGTIGLPDLVINSAGVAHPGYVQELDLDVFRWMMSVNYFGTVHVTKAVLPGMIERGSGYLVNISSIAGFLGVFGYTAYGASKFALRGFSDALRAELKPHGIGLSIVFPPDTDTPQLEYENQHKPYETKAMAGNAGMLRPDEVAESIIGGIMRRRYLILPGFESKLLFYLSGLFGGLVYPIMDMVITRAQKKKPS